MIENVRIVNQKNLLKLKDIMREIKKCIIGKDEIILKTLLAIISGGHILLEDIPGVGKTTLAVAFSQALSLSYNRMQFTPDVLPSDVTGFSVYNKNTGKLDYKPGTAFCNLFLADEINRTSSKTQSALLEIMEENRVTVDGITRELPNPFIVIATQNPIGSVGTQMLPESQLDRFTIKISMGYPDINSEISIIKSKQSQMCSNIIEPAASADEIAAIRNDVANIYTDDKILYYIARLADATRHHPMIKLGVSPRGTLALASMSKACALMHGRDFVIPDDVAFVFKDVTAHRILINSKAKLNDVSIDTILAEILTLVSVPKIEE